MPRSRAASRASPARRTRIRRWTRRASSTCCARAQKPCRARARVYPVGALTMKLAGEQLAEMSVLAEAGCVAFSQANVPIADTRVLWRGLQYAATFGYPVWLRAEDKWLSQEGVAHDGEVA